MAKKQYSMENKPLAEAVLQAIGGAGVEMAQANTLNAADEAAHTEVMADPEKALLVGYLAGFETALHVALCKKGKGMVKTLAMCMDMAIHDGETEFHDIAEELIADIMLAMISGLVATEGNGEAIEVAPGVIAVDATSMDEAKMKVAAFMAKMEPKKERSDA